MAKASLLLALTMASFSTAPGADRQTLAAGGYEATITLESDAAERIYHLLTTAPVRDQTPPDRQIRIAEVAGQPACRTGDLMFDGLYALAVAEALANSVPRVSDGAYGNGAPIELAAYQTGEFWKYVWTRDLAYSLHLGLAGFDPARAVNSLLFKASGRKASVSGGVESQIIQDTGSGGSYPVSTDRVVWAIGAHETLKHLTGAARDEFLEKIYPILCGTIEQDRQLVFDPASGLYRGEHSFLDWREQTYPAWTKENVLAIAMSKALSVNVAMVFLLQTTSDYARRKGLPEPQARYSKWADELKAAINRQFLDSATGLYRTYLLSHDGSRDHPVARYDLLGLSLALLFEVAEPEQAAQILAQYPTGPFGPPVIWPEERTVDIYHNQGIWPFVTAYWIKAAKKIGHRAAVDAGVASLMRGAALNLSNMENFDLVTGLAHSDQGPRKGPVINSRRQLWSVAGYLSMVQDVLFGLETTLEGIRFQPLVTGRMRQDTFGRSDTLELRGLAYRGTRQRVRIQLPPTGGNSRAALPVERVVLNGQPVGAGFVPFEALRAENDWEIFLQAAPVRAKIPTLKMVEVAREESIMAPLAPEWDGDGLGLEGGRLALSFRHPEPEKVTFNIYRDGNLQARGVRGTKWVDPDSADFARVVRTYAVTAVVQRGFESHLTEGRAYRTEAQRLVVRAQDLRNRGGNLVDGHHFENWGRPGHQLTGSFEVKTAGRYQLRAEFSNGAGPVNTGITCAVKRLEIRRASGEMIVAGYLIMPQSNDWQRWDLSSTFTAELRPGEEYTLQLGEDEHCRNMSYLANNAAYTAGNGGGAESYNFVNIASVEVLFVAEERRP